MTKLTGKQEHFANLVASGVNQTQAYREAYDTAGMKPHTIVDEAYNLTVNPVVAPLIATRKQVIQARLEAETVWTKARLLAEAETNLELNRWLAQGAAANGSLKLIAEVGGLLDSQPPVTQQITKVTVVLVGQETLGQVVPKVIEHEV